MLPIFGRFRERVESSAPEPGGGAGAAPVVACGIRSKGSTSSTRRRRRARGRAFLLTTAMMVGVAGALPAQTGTITGRVTDGGTAQPLASAQVAISGVGIGALTQQNGRFILINVPAGTHTVTVQRIGFRTATEAITVSEGQTASRDFALTQEALALNEIIVTGTPGGTERRAIGNVVTRVQASEITERAAISNMQQMLSGRSPGLSFQRSSGNLGTGSSIRIRGVSSLSLGQQPLIFVDGVRVDNRTDAGPSVRGGAQSSALDDFNPDDIETIEIIKGPAAATLYGTEASAGVIQIITKRGAQGTPQFDLSVHQGTNFLMNPAGKIGDLYGCRVNRTPCPADQVFSFNMFELEKQTTGRDIFQNGHAQGYNLAVRGGTDAVRYFLSGDLDDQVGVVDYNWLNRVSLRGNIGVLMSEALSLDVSTGYTRGETSFMQQLTEGGIWEMIVWGQGNLLEGDRRGFLRYTPEELETVSATRQFSRFTGSSTLTHRFRDRLTQRLIVGIDQTSEQNQVLVPRHPEGANGPFRSLNLGSVDLTRPLTTVLTADYGATVEYALNPRVSFKTSGGIQYYSNELNSVYSSGTVFASPAIRSIEGATNKSVGQTFIQNKSLGLFVQQEAAINDRIYLTAAVRGDDNSAFGSDYNAAIYPKLSGTWVVSDEAFWNPDLMNMFRLRTAWGRAGRQPPTFAAVTIYRPAVGPGGAAAVTPGTLGNPNVGPEVSSEIEVGFDAAFLDDRFSIEATYFSQSVTDALISMPLDPTFGFSGSQDANLGRLDNRGWELRLDARAIQRRNLGLDLGFSASHTMNEIKDLGGRPETNTIRVGMPYPILVSDILLSAELDQFGRPVNLICDGGTGVQDRQKGGAPVPCSETVGRPLMVGPAFSPYTFSVDGTLSLYRDLQVFGLVESEFGRWNSDSNAGCRHTCYPNTLKALVRNDPAYVEGVIFGAARHPNDLTMRSVYDASFVKLREVGARYNLPDRFVRRTGADRASLALSGRNLLDVWVKTRELAGARIADVELTAPAGGAALGQFPSISSLSATLRVSF